MTLREAGDLPAFPPSVALELVKRACELPDDVGRSLSVWTCAEMARALREAGVVETISPQSVQRILESQKLKPWRVHHWLSSKVPRDEVFYAQVMVVRDIYTRVLKPHECVLSLDEKTSIQPRTRTTATKPARPNKGNRSGAQQRSAWRMGAIRARGRLGGGLARGVIYAERV